MNAQTVSGQAPFVFAHRADLYSMPSQAQQYEVNLHGTFAIDQRSEFGHIYYGMPGCGMLRIDPDLSRQEVIKLPDELTPLNFHSTKIATFDGQQRLILSANNDEMVAVVTLEGDVDFTLPRPEFEQYATEDVPFKPTDTVLVGSDLYVADGYGANYIMTADFRSHQWKGIFGGKTQDPEENGKFATAHGLNLSPSARQLAIADRPHARIQMHGLDGQFLASHKLPTGAWPCGIQFLAYQGRMLAIIGSLRDPVKDRPAPIYILDASTYEVLSTVRPREELGIELAQHMHNVVGYVRTDQLFLICQAWNPGHYFVLEKA